MSQYWEYSVCKYGCTLSITTLSIFCSSGLRSLNQCQIQHSETVVSSLQFGKKVICLSHDLLFENWWEAIHPIAKSQVFAFQRPIVTNW
jgi:hypothetical protein